MTSKQIRDKQRTDMGITKKAPPMIERVDRATGTKYGAITVTDAASRIFRWNVRRGESVETIEANLLAGLEYVTTGFVYALK